MRWKSGEKAGIYTLTQPPSFDFPFSSEKIKCADEKGCAVVCKYKGWKEKRRWKDGEKAGIYTLTQPSSFGSSFSPEKRTCASLRTPKRVEDPGKTALSFGSSFSLEKECVYLYTRSPPGGICAYMGAEKEETERAKRRLSTLLRRHFALIFLFLLQK